MTNFNYDNYDDDTKAKYDDGIEFQMMIFL